MDMVGAPWTVGGSFAQRGRRGNWGSCEAGRFEVILVWIGWGRRMRGWVGLMCGALVLAGCTPPPPSAQIGPERLAMNLMPIDKTSRIPVDLWACVEDAPGNAPAIKEAVCTDRLASGGYQHTTIALLLVSRSQARRELGNFVGAMNDLNESIRIGTDLGVAYANRAALHLATGRPSQAVADYDAAAPRVPASVGLLTSRAFALIAIGQYDRAMADAEAAVVLDPRRAIALTARGMVHAKLNRGAEALRDFDAAIALGPREFAGWVERGRLRLDRGDGVAALSDLDVAVGLEPRSNGVRLLRGMAHNLVGNLALAMADLDLAIAAAPGNAGAFNQRAIVQARRGNKVQALADLEEAVRLDPASAAYRNNLRLLRSGAALPWRPAMPGV